MRLLNITTSGTFRLKEFFDTIPPYAILSHRWEEEEVTLEDLTKSKATGKKGYKKIELCCAQAAKDGFEYVWVDTCCIDKSSSHELQEAVNSMFSWYMKSDICYAYLSDCFTAAGSPRTMDRQLRESKWFTRGWTLQELIAPSKMVFYDRDWGRIGSKTDPDLKATISSITRVSLEILDGQSLQCSSVAQRMSWASDRKTTRPEDIAYCLIGLFDVTMPLIYGEGAEKAFLRLEEEIIKNSDDHSLFAWKLTKSGCSHGLLAPHPSAFADSHHIVAARRTSPRSEYGFTNIGLRISLHLACSIKGGVYIAALNCQDTRACLRLGLYLLIQADGTFVRVKLDCLVNLPSTANRVAKYGKFFSKVVYAPRQSIEKEPTVQEFHIHVAEGKIRSQNETLIRSIFSEYTRASSRASSATFVETTTYRGNDDPRIIVTSSGRRMGPKTFDFALGVGGTAGFMVRGFPRAERNGRGLTPTKKYDALLTFSATLTGELSWSVRIIKNAPQSLGTMKENEMTHWLDEYILEHELHMQGEGFRKSDGQNLLSKVKVSEVARRAWDVDACKRFEACVKVRPR
jgi:hypothetical protein